MKITLESTDRIVMLDGRAVRIWHGKTERGTEVFAYVALVASASDADASELEAALREMEPPADRSVWPENL